jgi:hypothetical protein
MRSQAPLRLATSPTFTSFILIIRSFFRHPPTKYRCFRIVSRRLPPLLHSRANPFVDAFPPPHIADKWTQRSAPSLKRLKPWCCAPPSTRSHAPRLRFLCSLKSSRTQTTQKAQRTAPYGVDLTHLRPTRIQGRTPSVQPLRPPRRSLAFLHPISLSLTYHSSTAGLRSLQVSLTERRPRSCKRRYLSRCPPDMQAPLRERFRPQTPNAPR